jgi:hypothetical protein
VIHAVAVKEIGVPTSPLSEPVEIALGQHIPPVRR